MSRQRGQATGTFTVVPAAADDLRRLCLWEARMAKWEPASFNIGIEACPFSLSDEQDDPAESSPAQIAGKGSRLQQVGSPLKSSRATALRQQANVTRRDASMRWPGFVGRMHRQRSGTEHLNNLIICKGGRRLGPPAVRTRRSIPALAKARQLRHAPLLFALVAI